MGYNDRLDSGYIMHVVKCGHCKKEYKQQLEDQVPGFRDMDYDICPYCSNVNDKSMSVEFHNSKIE